MISGKYISRDDGLFDFLKKLKSSLNNRHRTRGKMKYASRQSSTLSPSGSIEQQERRTFRRRGMLVVECYELIGTLSKQIQQLVVIHAVQCLYIDAKCVRHALHVEAEALQQLDEVHLLAGERIVQLRAAVITLRPSATFD